MRLARFVILRKKYCFAVYLMSCSKSNTTFFGQSLAVFFIIVNMCDITKIKICLMGLVAWHIQEEQGEKRLLKTM